MASSSWAIVTRSTGKKPMAREAIAGATVPPSQKMAQKPSSHSPGEVRTRTPVVDLADDVRPPEQANEGHQPPGDRSDPAQLRPATGQGRHVLEHAVEPHEPRDGGRKGQDEPDEGHGHEVADDREIPLHQPDGEAHRAPVRLEHRQAEGAVAHGHRQQRQQEPAAPPAAPIVGERRSGTPRPGSRVGRYGPGHLGA